MNVKVKHSNERLVLFLLSKFFNNVKKEVTVSARELLLELVLTEDTTGLFWNSRREIGVRIWREGEGREYCSMCQLGHSEVRPDPDQRVGEGTNPVVSLLPTRTWAMSACSDGNSLYKGFSGKCPLQTSTTVGNRLVVLMLLTTEQWIVPMITQIMRRTGLMVKRRARNH